MPNFNQDTELSKASSSNHWLKGRATTLAMVLVCLLVAGVIIFGVSGTGNSLLLLLLLACPLLHFFLHRGHGSEDHHDHRSNSVTSDTGIPKS